MDIDNYRVFMSVVENGNLTKAANELGYTQPGISQVIKKLEEECGFQLLFRTRKGIELTPDGAKMVPIMRRIIENNDFYCQTAASIRGLETGTVNIGSYASFANRWMSDILQGFHIDYPEIGVRIFDGGVHDITDWILSGHVDVGFLSLQP